MAVVSEAVNNMRQICLEGSRAEIVRARELLMKQGFLPRLDKEEWFDILEETIDHGDVLEITQLLGQGMYKELNDTQLLQSATIGGRYYNKTVSCPDDVPHRALTYPQS